MEVHEPIKRDRNLNITVIADDSNPGLAAVYHGVLLAEVFQASLTVMANFGFGFGIPESRHLPDDGQYLRNIRSMASQVTNNQIVTDYVFPEIVYKYAEEHNTAMFVIGVKGETDFLVSSGLDRLVSGEKDCLFTVKKAIKFIRQSRFPVMVVKCEVDEEDAHDWYKHILLPLDIERQNKEKALWAGYFSRFYGSVIHILYPKYKDEGLAKLVYDNVAFVEKLYGNLEVTYEKHETEPKNYLDAYALEFAPQVQAGASVIMMTRYYTLADVLTGPRERKIIGKTMLPVLCINQRDDLYVLCT